MGNKRNKCCCNTPPPWPPECPTDYYCIETGLSNNACGEDVPPFIGIGGFDCNGLPECCAFPTYLQLNSLNCTWTADADGGCGTWKLTQDGTLTLTMADSTVHTWLPVDGFSPLCTNLFEYDGEVADATCGVCRYVCSSPASACCDNVDGRTDPMPSTLNVTANYCCGLEPNLVLEFTITWDSSVGRWIGEGVGCDGAIMHVEMWCNGGIENGCGEEGSGYLAEVTYYSLFEWVRGWESCSCNPFEATFIYPSTGGCAAEADTGLSLVITE